jgi:predicted TIM-barrel fold metal-dependent hydrolase
MDVTVSFHGNHAVYGDPLARRYLDSPSSATPAGSRSPSELFRRQCYVSAEPEEELCKYVVAELGDDNLVLSTDWPHDDSRFPHSIDSFLAPPYLSSETKRKILWDNCARLYKLGGR